MSQPDVKRKIESGIGNQEKEEEEDEEGKIK
jgi:hypothetical protein